MVFLKNASIETTIKTTYKNNIGQVIIEGWKKNGNVYRVGIDPIDIKAIKCTWGEDIEAKYQVYADEELLIGDIVVWKNKVYEIEKAIDYINYRIYAIKSVDVEVIA
ncbi:hypothetical protein [Clostridium sp. UBA7791]|uniref:hypothetical protein n=1 Tax=Clostridium sp. UBA7791 TaxID=1946379 RepID=UPI003216EC7A